MRQPDPQQTEKKLRLAGELFAFAMAIKMTQLQKKIPHWSERALRDEAYRLMDEDEFI